MLQGRVSIISQFMINFTLTVQDLHYLELYDCIYFCRSGGKNELQIQQWFLKTMFKVMLFQVTWMNFTLGNINIIKDQRRAWHFLQFSTKTSFENHFPLECPITNIFKSLFSFLTELFMSCTSVKRDVSPANNFALEDRLLEESFI